MRFLSELRHGVYAECHDDTTHPEILARYAADNASNAVDVQAEIAIGNTIPIAQEHEGMSV